MTNYRIKLWSYPLFQIPLILLGICLTMLLLFWLLGFGRPQVAVAIALDVSGSTYESNIDRFNATGTILNQQVKAVQAYLKENNQETLRRPNQVKIFGFGGEIQPLNNQFDSNSQKVEESLLKSLQEDQSLRSEAMGNGTDFNLAIRTSIDSLKTIEKNCREMILVTDGQGDVSPTIVTDAKLNNVKINAIVVGGEAPQLLGASIATGGTYLSGSTSQLITFFTNNFFQEFNSNLKWIIFWLAMSWICLMWVLVLPLDRWVFQGLFNLNIDQSGKLALSNALFWTTATLFFLWRFWGIPFFSGC
ncbi:vWA domain-containing protein [Geminocystis herdmanii]|uniref:vWA domain-containing protein n=1 Tax=Geminocystis herdmanii TaxID=669359 RepID=UPI00036934DB|nr:vWA domain-containing protein [Geminocystis herdmanii]